MPEALRYVPTGCSCAVDGQVAQALLSKTLRKEGPVSDSPLVGAWPSEPRCGAQIPPWSGLATRHSPLNLSPAAVPLVHPPERLLRGGGPLAARFSLYSQRNTFAETAAHTTNTTPRAATSPMCADHASPFQIPWRSGTA